MSVSMLTAVLTAALLVPAAHAPAFASPAQEDPRFALRSNQSRLCLDTDGSKLAMLDCDGSADQVWMANDDGQFENVGRGVCLHSDEAGAVSLGECLDLPLLTWKPHTRSRVINTGTGFCLAAQDEDISSTACGSDPSQTWTLVHSTLMVAT
ncbi:ricin-type beta-trefoil lectin domain protein [Streptomyces sp. NPDC055749]